MQIPDRISRFIKNTHSFCIIMEEHEPSYIFASFDWAEQMLMPSDEAEIDGVNSDIALATDNDDIVDLTQDIQ